MGLRSGDLDGHGRTEMLWFLKKSADRKGFIGHLNWRNPASLSLLRTVHLLTLSFHKRNNDVELASLLPVAILTKRRLLRLLVFGGRPDDVLLTTVSDWRNWVHQRTTICLLTPNFLATCENDFPHSSIPIALPVVKSLIILPELRVNLNNRNLSHRMNEWLTILGPACGGAEFNSAANRGSIRKRMKLRVTGTQNGHPVKTFNNLVYQCLWKKLSTVLLYSLLLPTHTRKHEMQYYSKVKFRWSDFFETHCSLLAQLASCCFFDSSKHWS